MKNFLKKLADAGWRPHTGQSAYLNSTARFRVLACGRRWGKTDAAAAEIAGRIVTRESGKQIAIAPTLAQAYLVFDRVKWMLGAAGVICVASVSPYPSLRVSVPGTQQVVHILDARSGHTAKNLRGQGADHILMDEAAYMPESLITETVMPMLAASGGRMTLISTPFGRNHFYRFFQLGERGANEFWSRAGHSSENPLVEKQFLETQRDLLTDQAFRTEYLAEFLDSTSTVFGYRYLQDALCAPLVKKGKISVGIDWARHRDYTAAVAVRGTTMQAEVVRVDAWNGMSWSQIISRTAAFAKDVCAWNLTCDGTGIGDSVTEFLQKSLPGIPLNYVVFGNRNKSALIGDLAWMLEKGRLRLPADIELLREMEAYTATRLGSTTKYAAHSGHDDRVCALALACEGLPNAGGVKITGKERK